MSSTLTQDQYESLKIIEGERSTILTTGIVRLFIYHQKDQKWLYSGLCGALCLTIDRALNGGVLFRLYDLNTYEQLFEQELYHEFETLYQELNESFFCFPVIGNFVLAFSFADSNEALNFKLKIGKYCPKKAKPIQEQQPQTFPMKKGAKTHVFEKEENIIMEKPTNVKHLNHIGWDPINKCFDFSQLSKEFKTVFKNAGIKKKEMRDAETALAIYETLLNQGNLAQMKSKNNLGAKNKDGKTKKRSITNAEKQLHRKSTKKKTTTIDVKMAGLGKKDEEEKVPEINLMHASNKLGPNNSPPIPMPPPINLSLIGTPPPIDPSKISSKEMLERTPKKTISKPKPPVTPEGDRSNLIEQIKLGNFKLKKVEPQKPEPLPKNQLSKQEEMSLTMVLAKAIAERRKNLAKDDSQSEPESDWSDD